MSGLRIAHLTTADVSLRYLLLPQLLAIQRAGHEPIGISGPGPHVSELRALGIRHIALEASTRRMDLRADLKAAQELFQILRQERIDVLHTHNPKPGLYGRVLGRAAGVPLVVNTVHGVYVTPADRLAKRALVSLVEAIAARFSDAELYQSAEDLEAMVRLHVCPERKARFLGNGISLRRFSPERRRALRDQARQKLGLGEDVVVVGMVGRLVAEKGYLELFEANRRLGGAVQIVVAGDEDPDKPDALSAETIETAAREGIVFAGFRDDIEAVYAALDIFVLPSHREGFPRSAMEAAAMGLPVVATDIRGCREVVDHGTTGLLVPVSHPVQLADALRYLAGHPAERARLGQSGQEKARQEFDERRVIETVLATYGRLARRPTLSGHRRRGFGRRGDDPSCG